MGHNNIINIYMSVVDNDYQTNLLHKQFTGVAATQLDQPFSNEPYRAIKNIFSRDVFIEDIPDQAPISIYILDNSDNWLDSSGGAPSDLSNNSGTTFADLYPDSNLQFYKNVELGEVPGSQKRVWRRLDARGGNVLQDSINFKYDDKNSTYLMRVKHSNGAVYINNPLNSYPLFWILDNQSGYLQLYQTTEKLKDIAAIHTYPPKISFLKYVGKKGITNFDVSGQKQVGDISGIGTKISDINMKLDEINRMILPEGYVDISGATAPYDLSGSEVVRTYYNYVRSNSFIGYHNLPVMDSSAVDHVGDPSHNIKGLKGTDLSGVSVFELDVSGAAYITKGIVLGPSGAFLMEAVHGTHSLGSGTTGNMEMTTSNHFSVHTAQKQNALFVAAGGNVGIGTSAPGAALHVIGNSTALDVSGESVFRDDIKMHSNADISGNLNVQETRILQSSRIKWPLLLATVAPHTFPIAEMTMDVQGINLLGYFTLELNQGPLSYEYAHSIHFLAGYMASVQGGGMTTPIVYIKVLSNCKKDLTGSSQSMIDQLSFYIDPGNSVMPGQKIYLCCKTSALNTGTTGAGDLTIRLYKNFAGGVGAPQAANWALVNPIGQSIPLTATELSGNIVNLNLYDEPYGFSGMLEYFQKNIVVEGKTHLNDVSAANIDISENLIVTGHSQLNDVSAANIDITGTLTINGDIVGSDNTPMIEYIRYDNSNFNSNTSTPSITGSWQTIAQIHPISAYSAQVSKTRASYAIFKIVDRSNNNTVYRFQDNITCMISFLNGECTLNVLSSNPTGNSTGSSEKGYIGNIRLQCGKYSIPGVNASMNSANLQIKRFCDEPGAGTTDVRVRMYHNFQPILMPREFTPFVLTSTSLSLTNTITNTEFDVLNYTAGFKSSTTKRHYIDKCTMGSLHTEGDISVGSNNITNAAMISAGSHGAFPRIKLDSTGLELLVHKHTTNHKITLGDGIDATQQIYMRVNPLATLDINNVEISKVNKITSDQSIDICANNVIIGRRLTTTDLSSTNIDISNKLKVDSLITGEEGTTFVEYKDFSADISGTSGPTWYCIAKCEGTTANARGLFIIDDDTSGIREQIIFYAGTSYSRGNHIKVISHNWYKNSGSLTTKLRIDVSGTYTGANLYLYRHNSINPSKIYIRLYENGRDPSTGGRWVLTSTPIANFNSMVVNLDISYDPSGRRANTCSSLDHYIQGHMAIIGDISANNVLTNLLNLKNMKIISKTKTVTTTAPYVLGTTHLEHIDSANNYLVGSYKQIRSAFFTWSGNEVISYAPPNNHVAGSGSITPPCAAGGELFNIGTPHIWELSNSNYSNAHHTFTIPQMVEKTLMKIDFHIDIWFDSTGAARRNTIFFWLGKNIGANPAVDGGGSGPKAYRLATHHPAYFGTTASEPTFSHTTSITLFGNNIDFQEGDTFYFTGQCMGSPSFPRYKNLRIKITWESLH